MKASSVLIVCGIVLLTSCSASLPVMGRMQRSDETFDGVIAGAGYRAGTGELTIVSSRTRCHGDFVYTSSRKGEGVLSCDDGRTGPFHVAGVGSSGSGYGDLAGQRFTFTFGKPQS